MRIASSEAGGASETLDPAFGVQDIDASIQAAVYDRLVRPDEGYKPQPQLAESWDYNDTGDVWTFKLRNGVKFHDGRDFTARDVVYTFQRILDPDVGSAAIPLLGDAIDPGGVEAVDDYTVRFKLLSPVAEFPPLLWIRYCYIVPEGSTEEDLRLRGVGTGPFKVVEFTPGEYPSYFEKNENYWEPGLPKVDAIEIYSISEGASRNAALQAGQIDIAMDIDIAAVSVLEQDPDTTVISVKTPWVINLAAWCDTPPFDDNRVRLALKYCIDRQTMVDTVLLGQGTIANDQPVGSWIEYGWPGKPREQDYEKAKSLLAEAGYPDGLDLELYTADVGVGMLGIAQTFKEMAAGAGINVKIIQSPTDTYWSDVWMKVPLCCSIWSGRPCDEALFAGYYSKADWNETHFYNEEFDKLILDARRTMDYDRRKELWQAAQELLSNEGGAVIPMWANTLAATRANVEGFQPHATKYIRDFRFVTFKD
jgi:peptide/nickel transport system substrate-binding protein